MRPAIPVKVRKRFKASRIEEARWAIGDILIRVAGWVYPQ